MDGSFRAMRNTPDPHDAGILDALGRQAADYALHMMLTAGSVPPTVIADTAEGYVFCTPGAMADDKAKDQFANLARLLAVAYGARALVMVVEEWVRVASRDSGVDPATPPSEVPDRKEVVVVISEDGTRSSNRFLPIQRNAAGGFLGFGTSPLPELKTLAGRFSGFMPSRPQSAENVTMAKAVPLHPDRTPLLPLRLRGRAGGRPEALPGGRGPGDRGHSNEDLAAFLDRCWSCSHPNHPPGCGGS